MKQVGFHRVSYFSSKFSIKSRKKRSRLTSVFRCANTETKAMAARTMSTNSRGGMMPPIQCGSQLTLPAISAQHMLPPVTLRGGH